MVNEPTRRAIVYARISRDRIGAGLGVDRQTEDCRALAARLGWSVLRVESDNDISAYSGKPRPAYRRTLAALESGEATAVIAWHTDRLHRRPTELEEFIDVVERTGAQIATVQTGPVDLASPSGRMSGRIYSSVATHEIEHARERMKRAKAQMARDGQFRGGRRPFGYERDGVTIRPAEAEVIREATAAVLAGMSLRSLARRINDSGVMTVTGKPHTGENLRRILMRGRNAGKIEVDGEIIGDAAWPAIVSLDDLLAVRAVLNDPSRRLSPGSQRRWQGSGVYVCGETGVVMSVTKSSGVTPTMVYRPKTRVGGGASAIAEELDEYVSAVICERLSRPDARELLSAPGVDTGALTAKRAGIEARLDESAGLYAAGVLTAAQLTRATADLRTQLDAVDSELASAVNDADLTALVGAEDVRATWDTLDVDIRARIIKTLARVTVWKMTVPGARRALDPAKVSIEWLND